MKRKLALAATVGTLALSPPTPDDGAVREVPPIVQVADVVDYRDARPRLAFRPSADLGWLETWVPAPFFAGDRPVVRRGRRWERSA
jgi:hypothetical protein